MKTGIKKIASISGRVLLWAMIVLCALFIFLTLSQRQNNAGLANLFGYSPLAVQSNSMQGDHPKENFQKGDLIIVKGLDEEEIKDLQVGDIIVFRDIIENRRVLNAHRINSIINENGKPSFITKGDNNPVVDAFVRDSIDVVAVYRGSKLAGFGTVLDFLGDKWGFFFCLVVPLLLFFIWRVYKLVLVYRVYKRFDEDEANAAIEQANSDFLAKLFAEANVDPSSLDPATLQAILAKISSAEEAPAPEENA